MRITMVKKLLDGGRACDKCVQAEELLRSKGLWGKIDEVLWAVAGDPTSPGMALAERAGVTLAPFFIVHDDDGSERTYDSVLKFIRECLAPNQNSTTASAEATSAITEREFNDIIGELRNGTPQQVINWVLQRYGQTCALSFSGAEDVMLIDLAKQSGHPFSVFSLDTGRLHPQTYEFIERVRQHYNIPINLFWPDPVQVQPFVTEKGLFSFYTDGHAQCCAIRKVEPLGRALSNYSAWVTGQRRDQSPTRANVEIVQLDRGHQGLGGNPLLKVNPLAELSLVDVWKYLRDHGVPYNPLHDQGFVSIGCAPCTRALRPGEHERAGRWWWEDATQRECGLHR